MRYALMILAALMLAAPAVAETPSYDEGTVLVAMKSVMFQEPCCGACPRMSGEQGRKILAFLEGADEPAGVSLWGTYGAKILERLQALDPAQAAVLDKMARRRLAESKKE